MRGAGRDVFTGHLRGQIHLTDTKGGKPRTIQVSPELYALLEQRPQSQPLPRNRLTYAKFVEQAGLQAGETLTKTHTWRYCFARERYTALTPPTALQILTHDAAIQQVSGEMGHERANITMRYLMLFEKLDVTPDWLKSGFAPMHLRGDAEYLQSDDAEDLPPSVFGDARARSVQLPVYAIHGNSLDGMQNATEIQSRHYPIPPPELFYLKPTQLKDASFWK